MELVSQLSSLAHDNRLAIFRLLMRRYPDQVPAGEIAAALDLRANTTSTYLNALRAAGLITQSRSGTSLKYAADMDGARGLIDGLLGDCCRNRPDLCLPGPATAPLHQSPVRVLFICTGNSARSILAEALLTHLGQGRFVAHSAGTRPADAPRADVMALLRDKGIDTTGLQSKTLDALRDEPPMNLVFTVCDRAANEDCPVWPAPALSAHWGLPDPAQGDAAALTATYDLLQARLTRLMHLPLDRLDPVALQHELDAIGRAGLAVHP
ncbi:MAG: helix-turn-helix domain-containing protein [Marinibacterium sp.]|nr:helix-turn-helix domain-containing protein [Marinibacterium sp.]